MTETEKGFCRAIGYFYLDEAEDCGQEAIRMIKDLGITGVRLSDDNDLVITLARPGLLIGYKGTNIENLVMSLNSFARIMKIPEIKRVRVVEDDLMMYLLPHFV